MKKFFFFLAIVGVTLFFLDSCKKSSVNLDELRAQELQYLDDYLAANNIHTSPTDFGIYYIPEVEGTGDSIKVGDKVKIFFTESYILNDSTSYVLGTGNYEPYEFTVGSTNEISGLNEGITYMKQGGKATLIIPSEKAYGATANYTLGIPRFSTMVYNIEVYRHYPADTTSTQ